MLQFECSTPISSGGRAVKQLVNDRDLQAKVAQNIPSYMVCSAADRINGKVISVAIVATGGDDDVMEDCAQLKSFLRANLHCGRVRLSC